MRWLINDGCDTDLASYDTVYDISSVMFVFVYMYRPCKVPRQ